MIKGLPLPPDGRENSKQVCSHNAGRMMSPITVAVVAEDGRDSSAKIEIEAARRVMQ